MENVFVDNQLWSDGSNHTEVHEGVAPPFNLTRFQEHLRSPDSYCKHIDAVGTDDAAQTSGSVMDFDLSFSASAGLIEFDVQTQCKGLQLSSVGSDGMQVLTKVRAATDVDFCLPVDVDVTITRVLGSALVWSPSDFAPKINIGTCSVDGTVAIDLDIYIAGVYKVDFHHSLNEAESEELKGDPLLPEENLYLQFGITEEPSKFWSSTRFVPGV